jgi:hypothetical protein
MAYELGNQAISIPASADLSAKQFLFGTIDGNGQVAVTGAGLAADGIIACGADAQGRASAIYTKVGQIVKVVCGAAVACGDLLEADVNGRAVTQAAGKILAKALAGGGGGGVVIPALLILQR